MKEYTHEEFKSIWSPTLRWQYRGPGTHEWSEFKIGASGFYSDHMYRCEAPNDIINKPKHYYVTIDGKDFDCRAVQKALGMYEHHNIATAFAYIWRCLHKDNTVKDLEKAVNCLNEEIAYRKEKESK